MTQFQCIYMVFRIENRSLPDVANMVNQRRNAQSRKDKTTIIRQQRKQFLVVSNLQQSDNLSESFESQRLRHLAIITRTDPHSI